MFRFSELLNKVWGLEGFHSFLALRINRRARLGFGGASVLLACRGDQVSFNTTVGGDVLLKDKLD